MPLNAQWERKNMSILCVDWRLASCRRKYFRIMFASDCRSTWQSRLQPDLENCNKTSTLTSAEICRSKWLFPCTVVSLCLGQKNSVWRCFLVKITILSMKCIFLLLVLCSCLSLGLRAVQYTVHNWYFSPSIKTILSLAGLQDVLIQSTWAGCWVHSQRFFRWKHQF